MQQYDDEKGKRRLLDIETMKVKEVKDYYLQFLELEDDEKNNREKALKERIKQSRKSGFYEWILAIKSKDGKIIGKIEVMDMGSGIAFFTINLPNKSWKIKYGVEAIKQFVKICNENDYFNEIQLDPKNSIIQRYVKAYRKKDYLKKYSIDVKKVA